MYADGEKGTVVRLRPATYKKLQALSKREALRVLLREAEGYPDSVLTAAGYLLYTINQSQKKPKKKGG